MNFESTVLTRPGTLIINPPVKESGQQTAALKSRQEDSSPQQPPFQYETVVKKGDSQSYAEADKYREQQEGAYGATGRRSGVDAYQSLALDYRREEIKQMMGVDTYA